MSSKKWRKIKRRKSSATQILPDQKKKYSSKIWLKYYRFLVYKWCTYHLCHWASFRARREGRELSSARHSLVNNMCLIWFFLAFLRGAALRDWRRDTRNLFHIRDLMSALAHASVDVNWTKRELCNRDVFVICPFDATRVSSINGGQTYEQSWVPNAKVQTLKRQRNKYLWSFLHISFSNYWHKINTSETGLYHRRFLFVVREKLLWASHFKTKMQTPYI